MDNRDICSLVEDLLPMYAEGLVSDKTKIQIEKHIDNCDECKRTLENIIKDNDVFSNEGEFKENLNSDGEIKCIKNIKRKIIIKIIFAIIISVIITFLVGYMFDTYRIMKNQDGQYYIYNTKTGNVKEGLNSSNMLAEYTIDNNGKKVKYNIVFTFDENSNCTNARTMITGYDNSELNNFMETWKNSISFSNIKIENERLYMNYNIYIGKNKGKIIESLKEYSAIFIEI